MLTYSESIVQAGARCILCCHPTDAQSILGISQPLCLSASLSQALSLTVSQPHCLSASLTLRLSASLSLSLSISQPLSLSTSLSLSLSAGAVVGCAFFDPPSELLPEVVRQAGTQVFSIVAVQPELRGRGVGT